MASYDDLRRVIQHVTDVTHDPNAWKQGLSSQQVRDVNGWRASEVSKYGYTDPETGVHYQYRGENFAEWPQVPDDALNRIRDQHPTMFDKNTREMVTPATQGPTSPAADGGAGDKPAVLTDEQSKGDAAKAAKKLEKDLQDRNDKAVDADRHLAQALLNAHATAVEGAKKLNGIQSEIETAVNSATALDTPMGAREFQRFLAGKMRDIGDVLRYAQLDARSQTDVLAALSEFYGTDQGGTDPQAVTAQQSQQNPFDQALGEHFGLGGDLGGDTGGLGSGQDSLQSGLGAASQLIPAAAQIPQSLAGTAAGIPGAIMGAMPGAGGGAWDRGGSGLDGLFGDGNSERKGKHGRHDESGNVDDLLNDPGLFPPDENNGGDHNGGDHTDQTNGQANGQPGGTANPNPAGQSLQVPGLAGPTPVALKDGTATITVTADNPQLAAVIEDIKNGTPPADAYRNHNFQTSPPTSPPAEPFDVNKLRPGCYATYSSGDIVVALGPQKVIINGQVQPINAAMKAGFLGWHDAPTLTGSTPAAASPQLAASPAASVATNTSAQPN